MPNAWEMLTTTEEKLRHLEERVEINAEVDELLEGCMLEHRTLAASFERIFEYLRKRLNARAVFVHTIGENLTMETFSMGLEPGVLEATGRDLLTAKEPTCLVRTGLRWRILPLDIAGERIGAFGLALSHEDPRPDALVLDLMDAVAEELDQFFFSIQENRRKQLAIEAMQLALKNPVLVQAVDEAVSVLGSSIPVTDLVLLYLDEDVDGKPQIQYIVYRDARKAFDSVDRPMPELDRLVSDHGTRLLETGERLLIDLLPRGGISETRLIDGVVRTTLVGKMVLRPHDGSAFSLANREIIQIFTEALRQRLVDFNREKKILRKSFSPEIARRLIRSPDYIETILAPRARELAIVYADISGFTKLCEQILKDPHRIGEFINSWSFGAVERLYDAGGAFDKMVGDCIIGLFGPPFFTESPRVLVANAVRAARDIRAFTRDFLALPQNRDVQEHPLYGDLGVSIGVNYCAANVGLFGPDRSYTCFSNGMNNAARLQGAARAGEILVMSQAQRLIADDLELKWEGPLSVTAKNVKEPLSYYLMRSNS